MKNESKKSVADFMGDADTVFAKIDSANHSANFYGDTEICALDAGDVAQCIDQMAGLLHDDDLADGETTEAAAIRIVLADLQTDHPFPDRYIIRDDGGSEEEINADSWKEAREEADDWAREGEWGDHGASVTVYIKHLATGDTDSVDVEIAPSHAALIREVAEDNSCGDDPDDHNWTGEGHGGCDENPGVISLGGTRMSYASNCRDCGLTRTVTDPGIQRNPGETVGYNYGWAESSAE